jgi:hypothetical protein
MAALLVLAGRGRGVPGGCRRRQIGIDSRLRALAAFGPLALDLGLHRAANVGLAREPALLASLGDGVEDHALGDVVVGELLVGRGALAAGAALEPKLSQGGG